MKHVNFFPWIGENYFSKGFRGKRLLVLGESHHCGNLSEEKCPSCSKDYMKSECHSFTEDVINDYRDRDYRFYFYPKLKLQAKENT